MKIKTEQLSPLIEKNGLLPIYLIASDQPYLIYEAEDIIRQLARNIGYTERIVFDVDNRFDWLLWLTEIESISLFSQNKIIELRFSNKLDAKAQKILNDYANHLKKGIVVIVRTPKLDSNSLKSKWLIEIDKVGGVLLLNPPNAHNLAQWVMNKANQLGLCMDFESIQFLSMHNEGNLLAIMQELSRLKIVYDDQPINIEELKKIITNGSIFNIFDLCDAILIGDIIKVNRIIRVLQVDEEPVIVNFFLQKEINIFAKLIFKISKGISIDEAMKGIWDSKKPLYRQALKRFNLKKIKILIKISSEIDLAIKGQLKENAWNQILRLSCALCGKPFLPLSSQPI